MILRAYGLGVQGRDLDLPGAAPAEAPADVEVRPAGREEVRRAFSGPCDPPRVGLRRVDALPVRYERGRAGDVRVIWGEAGEFHLDARGAAVLAWAPASPPGPAWTRFLLDSVLTAVALHRGAEALHAASAELPGGGGAVAIAAGQGGGKTTLLATLLAGGARLVADDVSVLARREGAFAVEPAPPVLNAPAQPAPGAPAAAELGEVLAELGDERWVLARDVAGDPVPLRAVVRLERRPGARLALHSPPASGRALLGHVLDSGPDRERQARRFDLVADVAGQVPFGILEATPDTPPAELAATLLDWAGTDLR